MSAGEKALARDAENDAASDAPTPARPLVSAVITAYDRPDFLREAIASARAQTYPRMEIIVVDDCSPTDLSAVVASFPDGAVRYERLEKNSGANVARNRGVALARGEFVAFLDDDDIWRPDKTDRQIAAIGAREACLGGFGAVGDATDVAIWPHEIIDEDAVRLGNPFCGASGLFARRSALLETPFDVTLPNAQDWDLFVRLVQRGPLANVAEPVFDYRSGAHDGITRKLRKMTIADIPRRARAVYKHQDWLGPKYFGKNLAPIVLAYLPKRRQRLKLLA
ncbi:MAG: glycosyltransferase family 2 protein, partial [Pseudomonadota bacterium]